MAYPDRQSTSKQHIARLQQMVSELSDTLLAEYFAALDEAIGEQLARATNEQQWPWLQLSKTLQGKKIAISPAFKGHFTAAFACFKRGEVGAPSLTDVATDLSVVGKDTLERHLVVIALVRRLETAHTETIFALNQRLALLNGGKKLAEDGNPLAPGEFAAALGQMLETLHLETRHLRCCFVVFGEVLAAHLSDFYLAVNQYLVGADILPNLQYGLRMTNPGGNRARAGQVLTEPAQTGSVAAPLPARNDAQGAASPALGDQARQAALASRSSSPGKPANQQSAAQQAYLAGLSNPSDAQYIVGDTAHQKSIVEQIQQLQQVAQPALRSQEPAVSSQQLVDVIDSAQQASFATAAFDEQHVVPILVRPAQVLSGPLPGDAGSAPYLAEGDRRAIELVGMIFDFILGDDLLPQALKSVLSYLHTPYLKVAIMDPVFFEQAEHPARQLLNLLARTGHHWVDQGGDSQFQIYPKIKSVVKRVVVDFHNDVQLFHELLHEMTEFNEHTSRKANLLARRLQQKAEGEERLQDAKRGAYRVLQEKMAGADIPPAVSVLLLHPWADYMAFVSLRLGQDAEAWREALTVVDDVLWSIRPQCNDSERSRLLLLQAGLHDRLAKGLKFISFDPSKSEKLLASLAAIQQQCLQNQQVERLSASEKERLLDDVAGDLMVAEEDESAYSREEKALVEQLSSMAFGTLLEFSALEKGTRQRLKVAWFNTNTLRFMLVDASGRQVMMKTAIDLARLILAKQVKLIEEEKRPLLERALETIFVRLRGVAAQ